MDNKKIITIIGSGLISILFIILISLCVFIQNLQSTIQNLQTQVNNSINSVNSNINSIDSELSRLIPDIERMLIEQNKKYTNDVYEVLSYNEATGTALVRVAFKLKEYNVNDDVFVIAQTGTLQIKEETVNTAGLFTAEIEMDITKTYNIGYMIEGQIISSEDMFKINLKQLFENIMFNLDISISGSTNTELNVELNYDLNNFYQLYSYKKITEGTIKIYKENVLINTINIVDLINDVNGYQTVKQSVVIGNNIEDEYKIEATLVNDIGYTITRTIFWSEKINK